MFVAKFFAINIKYYYLQYTVMFANWYFLCAMKAYKKPTFFICISAGAFKTFSQDQSWIQ